MTEDAPESPAIFHKWEPITDLPENWHDLCRPDLHAIHREWVAERDLIKDPAKLEELQERLNTLWSIETGIIERLYTVERGVTVEILKAGMEALGQFHAQGSITADAQAMITDQREALGMVMDLVGGSRELTSFAIKELHQRMTFNQATREAIDISGNRVDREWPLSEKGAWKKWPNNPTRFDGAIHEYCPPEQVESEIDQLLAWSTRHEALNVCVEVEAAWLHHRFAQIHPFPDGNGRVARALTGAVFLRADHLVLVVRDEAHRERYIDALEAADKGDLRPLVDLFADIQIGDLRETLKTVRSLRGEETVRALEAAAAAARQSQDATTTRVAGALDELVRVASVRFEEIVAETQRAFEAEGVVVSASISSGDASEVSWPRSILNFVERDGHIGAERPSRWIGLQLGLPARSEVAIRLVVLLYPAGRQPRQHAASAFPMRPLGDGGWEPRTTFGDIYTFDIQPSNDEAREDVIAGFREWLEGKIATSLQYWTHDL